MRISDWSSDVCSSDLAVGFSAERGDVVALSARSFAPVEETVPSWWQAGWVSMLARNLTALALAALVIFGLARPLLRKGGAVVAKRAQASKAAKTRMGGERSEEHTSELQSLMRISYAVFCLKKKKKNTKNT